MDEPSRKFAKAAQVHALGQALLTMAQELWVVKDRQLVLEAALAETGGLRDLEAYQPDAVLAARIAGERKRFVAALIDVMLESGGSPP